jgi:hypothetical protein
MGDDLLDLPVLARVGLSAAPADAAPEVRARVGWVARRAVGAAPCVSWSSWCCARSGAGMTSCSSTGASLMDNDIVLLSALEALL